VRAFCRREDLAEPSFYAWRKRLAPRRGVARKSAGTRSAATTFAAVRIVGDPSQPKALRPDDLPPRESCVEIVLADGVRVRVPPGADRRTLTDVLVVLRELAVPSADAALGAEESPAC